MAGGTFDKLAGKIRPGTYINSESTRQDTFGISDRGTVLLPLINHNYGPAKEFITISNGSPDGSIDKLGYSVYDENPNMLLIREALKNAKEVIVYIPKHSLPRPNMAVRAEMIFASLLLQILRTVSTFPFTLQQILLPHSRASRQLKNSRQRATIG